MACRKLCICIPVCRGKSRDASPCTKAGRLTGSNPLHLDSATVASSNAAPPSPPQRNSHSSSRSSNNSVRSIPRHPSYYGGHSPYTGSEGPRGLSVLEMVSVSVPLTATESRSSRQVNNQHKRTSRAHVPSQPSHNNTTNSVTQTGSVQTVSPQTVTAKTVVKLPTATPQSKQLSLPSPPVSAIHTDVDFNSIFSSTLPRNCMAGNGKQLFLETTAKHLAAMSIVAHTTNSGVGNKASSAAIHSGGSTQSSISMSSWLTFASAPPGHQCPGP